jgi:hypothetical protein
MRRAVLFLACSAVVLVACRDKSIAQVVSHKGDLTRDTASTQQKWEPASDGAKLSMGDGLHTGGSAEAVVKLTRGGTLKMPPDTTIRFLASAPGAANPKLAVETGEASIQAEGGEVAIETEIGTAHIEAGGELRLAQSHLEVSIGSARIDTPDGGVSLAAGKGYDIAVGGAIIERPPAAPTDAGAPAVVDAGPPTPPTSGTVVEVHGKGVTSGTGKKTELADGPNDVKPGDRIRIPAGASIDLRRGVQHAHITGDSTITIGEEGGPLAKIDSGKAELEAGGEAVLVNVPGGSVLAKPGKTRVSLEAGASSTKVTVNVGEADLRGKTTETLRTGENGVLNATGGVTAPHTVATADLTVKAGESVNIRDPKPPTALGIDFSSVCPGAAVLTRGDTNFRADKRVNIAFPAGVFPYSVHCIGADGVEEKEAAKGLISVVADAARADIPKLPPSTVVDADGRKYTILYQNLLPQVVARWTGAPGGGKGATLIIDGKKQAVEPSAVEGKGARATLKSGSLGEGTHTLKFEANGQVSPETTLVVKFDNAAPAASIREPADGSFGPTDTVKVAGLVSEGWTVSINGTAVPLDEQQRFSTTATPVPGENAIVLRLSHPTRGVVYYVRHAGAAHP